MNLRVPKDLSALVRGTRTDHGISQDELARRAGVSRKTVNEVERGVSDPRLSNLLAILDALELTLSARLARGGEGVATEGMRQQPIDLDQHLGRFDDE